MTTRRRTKKPPKDRAPESIEEGGETHDPDAPTNSGVTLWGADSAGFTDDALPEVVTVQGRGGRYGA